MIISTKYFEQMDCPADSVIRFPGGLPGFEHLHNFICLEQPETRPLVYLQSVDQPDICFLTLPVRSIYPHYDLSATPEDRRTLGCTDTHELLADPGIACLTIIAIAGDMPTANLLAPVIINHRARVGLQMVQYESGYSHCHPLTPRSEPVAC